MRLFRQKSPGVWDGAIADVAQALRERAAGNPLAASADSSNGIEASRAPRILTPVARRVEYVVPGLAQVAETRFGLMQYLPDQPRVGESLRRYGEYLHGQLMILAAVGLGNRLVVEASAGVGHHALFLASALRPDGHVILYENDHRLRRLLRENLSSNGLANTTVMRRPLREAPVSENVVASEASASASEIIDDLRLQHLDWLKIGERVDAAGILAGASDTIWRTRPKLFVAGSDAPTVGKLAQQVRDFGYSCWRVSTPTFNPDNFNLCSEASSDDVLAFALLALPEEAGREMSFSECERLV
jgi:hypothetical protein